jgi:hypothetical protein
LQYFDTNPSFAQLNHDLLEMSHDWEEDLMVEVNFLVLTLPLRSHEDPQRGKLFLSKTSREIYTLPVLGSKHLYSLCIELYPMKTH